MKIFIGNINMSNMVELSNQTLVDDDGKILFFGFEQFVDEIFNGDNCFICGAKPSDKLFNDEHVIPKWLLRHCGLFNQNIILPNKVKLRYDKYVLPCCKDCNSFYGEKLEEKVRPILTAPYAEIKPLLNEENVKLLYIWFTFVVFKTHLKDTLLQLHLDRRKGKEKISSKYQFEWLYHMHILVRTLYTGAEINSDSIGTFTILEADEGDLTNPFDYRDINGINTGLIRIGDKALLCAIDDAFLSARFLHNHLKAVQGHALSPLQLREMLAHLTYIKKSLVEQPIFKSKFDFDNNTIEIIASKPTNVALVEYEYEDYGSILYLCTFDLLDQINNIKDIHSKVRSGKISFTVGEDYQFAKQSSPIKA